VKSAICPAFAAVLADGEIVGRIFKADVSVARPWMWTLDMGHLEHRNPTHGYAATRELP
jgi:hypothetical protein